MKGKAVLLLIFALTCKVAAAQQLLSHPVDHFSAQGVSPAVALVRLAIQSQVPVGIEQLDKKFASAKVSVSIDHGTLDDAYRAILGKLEGYQWTEAGGVVIVTKRGERRNKNLFDEKLPEYWVRRRASLPEANNLLWMTLMSHLNPQNGGYAGSFSSEPYSKLIDPCDLRDVTVREVLNYLVSSAGGAGWIATASANHLDKMPKSGLWKILPTQPDTAEVIAHMALSTMSFDEK